MSVGVRMCMALLMTIVILVALTYPVGSAGPGASDLAVWINHQVAWANSNQTARSLSTALVFAINLAIHGVGAIL